jgi:hypothetical protein
MAEVQMADGQEGQEGHDHPSGNSRERGLSSRNRFFARRFFCSRQNLSKYVPTANGRGSDGGSAGRAGDIN